MAIIAVFHVALGSRLGSSTTEETSVTYYSPTCNSISDCTLKVRSRFPSAGSDFVGPCECYAASNINPFDECEGESDATCAMAKCGYSCSGQVPICKRKRCFMYPVDLMEDDENEESVW